MSEEGTVVAAPVTEAAPAPPPVVEETPATPEAPVTPEPSPEAAPAREGPPLPPRSAKQVAKESMLKKAAAAAEAYKEATRTPGVVDEKGRTHASEDGTYMEGKEGAAPEVAPEEGAAPAAPEKVEGAAVEVAAEPAIPDDKPPPAAETAGEEFVTIALAPDGPLAGQGLTELKVPANLERQIRALVNSTTRERDVDASKSALQDAHLENARLSARVQALAEGTPDADPLQADMLAQIKEHYPEQLEGVEAALEAVRTNATSEKEAEIYAGIQREHVSRVFMQDISDTSAQKYPAWADAGELANRMASAMAQYGDYVDARNANLARRNQAPTEPTPEEFYGWVDTQYIKDPRVQDQVQKYRAELDVKKRADIAAEERQKLAEEERKTLAEAAERHAGRPPSTPGIPSQGNTAAPPAEDKGRVAQGDRAKVLRRALHDRLSAQTQ